MQFEKMFRSSRVSVIRLCTHTVLVLQMFCFFNGRGAVAIFNIITRLGLLEALYPCDTTTWFLTQ